MYRYVQKTKKTLGTTLLYIFYKMAYWEVWTITGKTSLIVPVSQTQRFYALNGKTDINTRPRVFKISQLWTALQRIDKAMIKNKP